MYVKTFICRLLSRDGLISQFLYKSILLFLISDAKFMNKIPPKWFIAFE